MGKWNNPHCLWIYQISYLPYPHPTMITSTVLCAFDPCQWSHEFCFPTWNYSKAWNQLSHSQLLESCFSLIHPCSTLDSRSDYRYVHRRKIQQMIFKKQRCAVLGQEVPEPHHWDHTAEEWLYNSSVIIVSLGYLLDGPVVWTSITILLLQIKDFPTWVFTSTEQN